MSDQFALFDDDVAERPKKKRRPRIAYKQTSREAFHSFATISGELDRAILETIRDAPVNGIICEHIERAIGRKHQAVSGNLRHLVERKLVKHSGDYGRTQSGRKAMKWIIA